jgi:hypothetical protein
MAAVLLYVSSMHWLRTILRMASLSLDHSPIQWELLVSFHREANQGPASLDGVSRISFLMVLRGNDGDGDGGGGDGGGDNFK